MLSLGASCKASAQSHGGWDIESWGYEGPPHTDVGWDLQWELACCPFRTSQILGAYEARLSVAVQALKQPFSQHMGCILR